MIRVMRFAVVAVAGAGCRLRRRARPPFPARAVVDIPDWAGHRHSAPAHGGFGQPAGDAEPDSKYCAAAAVRWMLRLRFNWCWDWSNRRVPVSAAAHSFCIGTESRSWRSTVGRPRRWLPMNACS